MKKEQILNIWLQGLDISEIFYLEHTNEVYNYIFLSREPAH